MRFFIKGLIAPKRGYILLIFVVITMAGQTQNQRPVLTLPIGHQQPVHTVAFSRDGKLIVTGGLDNTFILWDAKTGFLIRRTKLNAAVLQVIFTPDNKQIITLSGQSEAKLAATEKPLIQQWDIKTGNLVKQLPFTGSPGIQFLPSGYILVPDYSDDLTKSGKSFMQEYDISDPDKLSKNIADKYNDAYMDSMAAAVSKDIKMPEFDAKDPAKLKKQLEDYQRQITEKMMGGTVTMASMTKRNITLIDGKTFKPVASMPKTPDHIRVLVYNNTEYLVSPYEADLLEKKTGSKVEALKVNEFISQYQQKIKINAAKTFNTGKDIQYLATSSKKGLFAIDSGKNAVQLWQIDKTTPLGIVKAKGSNLLNIDFSPGGDTLYVFSIRAPLRYIEAWNTATLEQVLSVQLSKQLYGANIYLAGAGNYFAVDHGFGLVKLNLKGDSITQLHGNWAIPTYQGFSKDDNEVYVGYNVMPNMGALMKMSASSMKQQLEMQVDLEAKAENKTLSKTEKDRQVNERMALMNAAASSSFYKGYLLNWDLQRGGAYFSPANNSSDVHKAVSADNNYQVANEKYESANKESGQQMVKMMKAAEQYMTKEQIDMMGKFGQMENNPYAQYMNGPVTLLINRKTRDTISLIKVDSIDWIMLHKKGYYMTSRNGAKAMSYTRGLDVMPFEQFDIQYNRPDIVLKAIGKADPALIQAYHNAWEKRLKKMGIDSTQFKEDFNVPEADFGNRDKIEREQKTGKLNLVITGSDNKVNLNRFNIWVNEVPLFGKNGKSLKEARSGKLNTSVEIVLSQGINRIETSVINDNGVESYRTPLIVNYTPVAPVTTKLYFIGIGINKFADTSHNLQYCEKDIRDLSQKLKEKYGAAMQTTLLFNEEVTTEKVKALKQQLLQSHEDDKVIIAYSGHGLLNKNFDYYLSTYAVNFNQPEQSGMPYDELEDLVDGIRARKKLLLIDACHSGEVDKEELQKIVAVQAELKNENNVSPNSKGLKLPPSQNNRLGTKNSFELMQELFVNVGRGTGTTIISAAAGTQFALERGDLKNGVFTYSILELLNSQKTVTVDELKRYVSKRVSELTKGLQQPTTRNEIQNVDWIFW